MANLFRWISGNFTDAELYDLGELDFHSRRLDDVEPTVEDMLAVQVGVLRTENEVLRSELVLLR
ncbi:MAG: hypothetical protein GY861_00255 [bacterium]|nr:hypothetical protein [bacterium]